MGVIKNYIINHVIGRDGKNEGTITIVNWLLRNLNIDQYQLKHKRLVVQ